MEREPAAIWQNGGNLTLIDAQGVPLEFVGNATDANEGPGPGPGKLPCHWMSSNASDVLPNACIFNYAFTTQGVRTLTMTATDTQGQSTSASVMVTVTAPPANFPPVIGTTSLPPPNYEAGYKASTVLPLRSSATDPEGNTPITYVWKATSFVPKSTTVIHRSNITVGTSNSVDWTPASTAGFIGNTADFGNDCYDGQTVRIRVEATDSLGNTSSKTLPDIRVYACELQ